jgi:hypothetical protein
MGIDPPDIGMPGRIRQIGEYAFLHVGIRWDRYCHSPLDLRA